RVVDARGQGEERLVLLLVTAVVPVRGQRHHLVPLLARLDQRQGERDVVVLLRHLLLGGLRRRPVRLAVQRGADRVAPGVKLVAAQAGRVDQVVLVVLPAAAVGGTGTPTVGGRLLRRAGQQPERVLVVALRVLPGALGFLQQLVE